MDYNFQNVKKDVAATADDIYHEGSKTAKQAIDATSQDLLGGIGNVANTASGIAADSPGKQDDNAHTEHYFANEQRNIDFDKIDPQDFVQRMAAEAKQTQEQLNAKFAQPQNDFDDFLGHAGNEFNNFSQDLSKNMAAFTNDFMNAERGVGGYFGGAGDTKNPVPSAPAAPPAPTIHDDFLGFDHGKGFGDIAATAAPVAAEHKSSFFDDDKSTSSLQKPASDSASNKDSDTDSPSISYNASPAKKQPVADKLKEQDHDKFISSEDLLGDFKQATPEHKQKAVAGTTAAAASSNVLTTDLDADDDDDFLNQALAETKAKIVPAPAVEKISTVTPIPAAVPAVAATTVTAPVVDVPKPEPVKPVAVPAVTPTPTPAARAPAKVQQPTQQQKPATSQEQLPNIISVEDIFYKYGLDAWFKPERLHPKVESLIYWRDVKKSGIVFGIGLVTLLAISCFSVISVFAYLSLLGLALTVGTRIYKTILQAVQKTTDGHPFKEYLELDLTLSQDKVQNVAGIATAHVNGFIAELRRLFLVEDLVDSIKFGVILWLLTYVGAWFNGMTLLILAFVALFTLPKVYENNKQSIDTYLDLVRSKFAEVTDKIKAAIPIGQKKPIGVTTETDKDK